MALIGDLRDIKMQDILRFVKRVSKSGVLKIKGKYQGEIYFKDGKIVNIRTEKGFVEWEKALDKCISILKQNEGEFRLEPREDIKEQFEIDPDSIVNKMR